MKNHLLLILLTFFFAAISHPIFSQTAKKVDWKNLHVLVYSKNGKGYVHDNIPSAVACIQNLGKTQGFKVDTTADPAIFTRKNLEKYDLMVFTSTNNDVFDTDEQRLAFRHYIEAGGGFVGLHSVVSTERNWAWFKMMLGGTFAWHPKFQKYKIQVIDGEHPSVAGLPNVWEKDDECYFQKEMYPGIKTLLAHDIGSLKVG